MTRALCLRCLLAGLDTRATATVTKGGLTVYACAAHAPEVAEKLVQRRGP